ncbi:methyl-accepting chemotaxis sensory transducer with Cache sensor [Oceanotoga teriensis]|uniref:Methyl-accepting chemotaxis sensory transducer with Cache sensor n=1 Tax=Oceanotoga teriensis TaxID=515440 RepID=A0AA45C733_9BACT|nr:methyl-accepting chemotaxis protein [Oceanotoga teriensis]PWJ95128.1 methyl-accepting chemotaxis sensory transducer with Cache sensor [Oceanotoga teriensis]
MKMKLFTRILLSFLIISIIPITLLIYMQYTETSEILKNDTYQTLNSINDEKLQKIENILNKAKTDINHITNIKETQDAFTMFKGGLRLGGKESSSYQNALKDFKPFFDNYITSYQYSDIILIEKSGQILYNTTQNEMINQNINETNQTIKQLLDISQEKTNISDYIKIQNQNYIYIISPINSYGRFAGWVMLEIPEQKINQIIQNTENKKYTSYITNSNSILKTPYKNQKINEKIQTNTNSQELITSNSLLNIDENKKWTITTQVDKNEAFKTLNSFIQKLLIIAIIIIVIVITIAIIITRTITNPIKNMVKITQSISNGDLSQKIEQTRKDEIGQLAQSFNKMIKNISTIIENIKQSSETVSSSSEELSSATQEGSANSKIVSNNIEKIKQAMDTQLEKIQNSESTLEEFLDEIKILNTQSQKIEQNTNLILTSSDKGKNNIEKSINQIKNINQSTENSNKLITEFSSLTNNIGSIVDRIENISQQINLLGLNASIEAARAGEFGKGFSVVAEEIRTLSEDASKATKEINSIVENIKKQSNKIQNSMKQSVDDVSSGIKIINNTNETFEEILSSIQKINQQIKTQNEIIKTLNQNSQKVKISNDSIKNSIIESINTSDEVQEIATNQTNINEEIAESSNNLSKLVFELTEMIEKFKL